MLSGQRAEESLQSDRIIISLHICREPTGNAPAIGHDDHSSGANRHTVTAAESESLNWGFKYVGY